MTCPYCHSRKIAEESTAHTYDVRGEYIAVNRVICGRCGGEYAKTIRENPSTGKRKVLISKTGNAPVSSQNGRLGILSRFRRKGKIGSPNRKMIAAEKEYRIVMNIFGRPEHVRALRDELDELCDTCVQEGDFIVYDSEGNEVMYGEE